MLFNSYAFIFAFLPITLLGFYQLARLSHAASAAWLVLASVIFYGYWNPAYVGLLLCSIIFNYMMGYWMAKAGLKQARRRQKQQLFIAISTNLALLIYYKYSTFLVENLNNVAGTDLNLGTIILPLGISFFTFTQIAFLVDVYQGKVKEYNFIHYVLFVTYFPHLIAGPVLHHKDMMPQFARPETYRLHNTKMALGITIFVLGLAKKVIFADSLAAYPSPIFAAVAKGDAPMLIEAWIAALSYTFQLYFDFSGYSDMAIGLSLMFNVRLPMNFNSPYKSTSIIDFWRRWHITLSHFLRDYLYIPLGGNRKGNMRRHVNLMTTMLLGGLWHGAGWTFLIWGGLHGVYLTINHAWRNLKAILGIQFDSRLAKLLSGTITFLAVVIGWVFFKAENMATAMRIISGMLGMNGVSVSASVSRFITKLDPDWMTGVVVNGLTPLSKVNEDKSLIYTVLACVVVWGFPNTLQLVRRYRPVIRGGSELEVSKIKWRLSPGYAWFLALIFVTSISFLSRVRDFLYFQF